MACIWTEFVLANSVATYQTVQECGDPDQTTPKAFALHAIQPSSFTYITMLFTLNM